MSVRFLRPVSACTRQQAPVVTAAAAGRARRRPLPLPGRRSGPNMGPSVSLTRAALRQHGRVEQPQPLSAVSAWKKHLPMRAGCGMSTTAQQTQVPQTQTPAVPAAVTTHISTDDSTAATPSYLSDVYWWAYVHPNAVSFFERQWLVNAILWGNFDMLRDAALTDLSDANGVVTGKTLQVACVYGDFSEHLCSRMQTPAKTVEGSEGAGSGVGSLHVVDVLDVQLQNTLKKLPSNAPVHLHRYDSTNMGFEDGSFDQAVLFFLLHEQPAEERAKTLADTLRVIRPGGRLVVVDYHGPEAGAPLRFLFRPVLELLEPFALDLWEHNLMKWMPEHIKPEQVQKETFYGGLYQKLIISV